MCPQLFSAICIAASHVSAFVGLITFNDLIFTDLMVFRRDRPAAFFRRMLTQIPVADRPTGIPVSSLTC
jgi:hypothetical protein